MLHDMFQDLLDTLARTSGVGQEVLGEVLARTSLRAPEETSRREIAAGDPSGRRRRQASPRPGGSHLTYGKATGTWAGTARFPAEAGRAR